MFFYYMPDIYYIALVLPAIILSLFAQLKVKSTFAKYSSVLSASGTSGYETARKIMDGCNINDVDIRPVAGRLTDNFNPATNTVSLSSDVYSSTSIAAIGVAAHETGHVIQHRNGYLPIKLRKAILPVANIGSGAAIPLAILGLFLGIPVLVNLGIMLYAAIVLFQVVTLPVEFNASRRALSIIESKGILNGNELVGAKKVLTAAALTYVAAMLTSIMSLIRLILLARDRD